MVALTSSELVNRRISRRKACGLLAIALGAGLGTACSIPALPITSSNRVASSASVPDADQGLKPRMWKQTVVQLGASLGTVSALHFAQKLQLPVTRIPYVTSMLFYAPQESPVVMIGIYYERNDQNQGARAVLTSQAFGLQTLTDLDQPIELDASQINTVKSRQVTAEQVNWAKQNQQAIFDSMRSSSEGQILGKTYDSDFVTKVRPDANIPAALVLDGATYLGIDVPYTVFGERLLFVG